MFSRETYDEISVETLAFRLAAEPHLQLIDVREPQEWALAHIPGFRLFPLSQFDQWAENIKQDLNPDEETLVLCHHGVRSAQMCDWLRHNGFTQVRNIQGGIDAYSRRVDRTIPRY